MKWFLRVFVVWSFFFALFSVPQVPLVKQYFEISRNTAIIEGRIVKKTEYRAVKYEFSVDGRKYSGISRTGIAGIPVYGAIDLDDAVTVYYDGHDPTINTIGHPDELFQDACRDLFYTAIFSLFGVLMTAIVMRLRSSAHRNDTQKDQILK